MSELTPSSMTRAQATHRPSPPCVPHDAPVVFVVDDDLSVRQSLELLILSVGWQVETFASAREFLESQRPRCPGCLVLDLLLPGLSGLDLQERITATGVGIPIIFITGYRDVPMTVRAMKGGAIEFLTKPFRNDVLLAAIGHAIERSRAALADEVELRALRERHASLTPREREIMMFVVAGRLNKQIASVLGISEITVKAHRGQMMRKMKAPSLPHLVNMVARLGCDPPEMRDARITYSG